MIDYQEKVLWKTNARIVNQPTSSIEPESPSALSVAVSGPTNLTPTQILTARIKVGLAMMYLIDLEAWQRDGDAARFSRMVDASGKQLGDASRWLAHLANICANPFVVAVYPELPAIVADRLAALGLMLPTIK